MSRLSQLSQLTLRSLAEKSPGPHKIQGIGAGFIPKTLKTELIDEILKVDVAWAISESRKAALQEGILIGISSGANLWAAREIAKRNPNKNIVTILCDTGERYLSTDLYETGE